MQKGYSLVETMLVLVIVTLLILIAWPRFSEYWRHIRSDSQTRLLYGELLQARAQAVYQRRGTRVKICRDRFYCYSSQADEEQDARPAQTFLLTFPITSSAAGDEVKGYCIDFDARGIALNLGAVCLESVEDSGSCDSVVIAATRVDLGKKDKGYECAAPSISRR